MPLPISRPAGAMLAALALLAGPARADDLELRIENVGLRDGALWVRCRLDPGFDTETRSSIERGLPITVRYTAELWRKRRLWFDKQVDSRVLRFRIRYDPGERLYSVTGSDPHRAGETFDSLDAAFRRLSPRTLEVHPNLSLEERHVYYVTVELALQPLTVEEFRELDGWISGRIRGDGEPESAGERKGNGGVSGALFGFLLDLTGFGDKTLEAETPPFRAPSLEELPGPEEP